MVVEVLVVMGLSLGQSGVYAFVRLLDMLSRAPLSEAQANLNVSANDRQWFDLTYQLLGISFALVPVALALLLLHRDRLLHGAGSPGSTAAVPPVLHRLGVVGSGGAWRDLGRGGLLLVVIGLGTLGIYAAGRTLGLTAQINTDNLATHWWTVPVLLLAAVKNGVLEEVLLMGYLRIRLHALGWSPWTVIVTLSLLRGSYHLYQGVGPFIGNVAMGLIFGWCALRWEQKGRPGSAVMPFVWAHILIDAVGFLAPGILHMADPLN